MTPFIESTIQKCTSLFVVVLGIVVRDVEVAQLVHALRRGNDVHIVAQLLLLQVLLGQVLEVALREWELRSDENLRLLAIERHLVAKLPSLAVNLDAIEQEKLELSTLEEAILEWHRIVDGELHELLVGRFPFLRHDVFFMSVATEKMALYPH